MTSDERRAGRQVNRGPRLLAAAALAGAAALAAAAVAVNHNAAEAEHAHPPAGRFLRVGPVKLHYTDSGGPGPAVVMFHGNGALIADLEISGLVERTARRHRTIVFDRPGFGWSSRPRDRNWDATAQAAIFARALRMLGVERPILFGHSWGTLVALALALEHPGAASGLVLASGYYYPQARADVTLLSAPALPVIGDLMRHTLTPLMARALAPEAFATIFAPRPVTADFAARFPLGMALRPSQLRAIAEDNALMNPSAAHLARRYRELVIPTAIIAGETDRIVETERQSVRLHREIPQSTLHLLPETGHMLHHSEPMKVADLIHDVASRVAYRDAKRVLAKS